MTSEGSMADDFAGFEASMRGKLSELRLPSEDDSTSPTKIINSSFTETDLVGVDSYTHDFVTCQN